MQNNNMIQTIDNIALQISEAKKTRKEELENNIKDIEATEDFVMIRISDIPNSEWCFILKKDKTVKLAPVNSFSDNTYAVIYDNSDINKKVNAINDKINNNEPLEKIRYGYKTYYNITLQDLFKKTKKDEKIMNKLKDEAKQKQRQCCDMINVVRQEWSCGQPFWIDIYLKPLNNRLEEFEYTYNPCVEDIIIKVILDDKGKCKSVNVVSQTHQDYLCDELKAFEESVNRYLEQNNGINILNIDSFFCCIPQSNSDMSKKWKQIFDSDLYKIQNVIRNFKNHNQFNFNLSEERIDGYPNIAKTIKFVNKKRVYLQDQYNKYKAEIDDFIKKLGSDNKGKLRNFEKFLKTTKEHLLDELKQSASMITLDKLGFLQYDITNNTISMRHDGSRDKNLEQNKFLLELNNENKLSCLKYHVQTTGKFITISPKYKIEYKGKQYHLEKCMLYHNEGLVAPVHNKSTNKTKTKTNTYVNELKKNLIEISKLRKIEESQHKLHINAIGNDNDIWNSLLIKLKPRRNVKNKNKTLDNLVKNGAYKYR